MYLRSSAADLLLALARQPTIEEQEASFRGTITALAAAAGEMGPPLLDGIDPRAVEAAVLLARDRGLLDKIEFLRPGSAALALYELSAACPSGEAQRELRRRVYSLIYRGNANAFLPVATRIGLGAAGPLKTQTLRARVGLCLDLPIGTEENVGPLALALATRSATRHDWVIRPSRLALPGRRMAAQILEFAAKEAVSRYQIGDPQPRNLLLGRELRGALRRLLADREPLVWQHAAVARGLLAAIDQETRSLVEQDLAPQASVTQWRRSLTSLVSAIVLGDQDAHSSVHAVLGGTLPHKDPGIMAAMVPGLAPVIETEPDRAENLLDRLALTGRPDVAVAVASLLERTRDEDFGRSARRSLASVLDKALADTQLAERPALLRAQAILAGRGEHQVDLAGRIYGALELFERDTAESAYEAAVLIAADAHTIAQQVEEPPPNGRDAQLQRERWLLELDLAVFQRPLLSNLLLLGRRPGAREATVEQLERLQNRTSRWILAGLDESADWSPETTAFDLHRLRILLRLVDAEGVSVGEGGNPLADRVQQSVLVLLEKLARGADPGLHRVLCATLARSFDAAVRDDLMKSSDIVLVVATMLSDHESVATIAEASTAEDVASPLRALANFMNPDRGDDEGALKAAALSTSPLGSGPEAQQLAAVVVRVMELSQGIVGGGGYHAEALRRVFFRLGRALEAIAVARGQSELVDARDAGPATLEELERAVADLYQMIRCAERRVLGGEVNRPSSDYQGPGLRALIDHAISMDGAAQGTSDGSSEGSLAPDAIARATESLVMGLPETVGALILQVTLRIQGLPRSAGSAVARAPLAQGRASLPNWLLPRRTIGSFYVVRPLGTGGVSSVFVARRLEDKADPKAEAFALKVPEYDPATARSLSEDDFFQMFREEAGALLSLPEHENLARFVTFDLSARPKPILVMELIRGTALDRLIRSRALSMGKVASYLDGILAGLQAMHRVGVGHLDLKATNVILRDGSTPVLVDFGLSGRHIRPGCGTVEYTSPEVLGVVPEGASASPLPADIYSFGCLAYELLTGRILFQAPDEMALVTRHVSHDGWLPELAQMNEIPGLGRLARIIAACLRHDPRDRLTATALREKLSTATQELGDLNWPVEVPVHARAG